MFGHGKGGVFIDYMSGQISLLSILFCYRNSVFNLFVLEVLIRETSSVFLLIFLLLVLRILSNITTQLGNFFGGH